MNMAGFDKHGLPGRFSYPGQKLGQLLRILRQRCKILGRLKDFILHLGQHLRQVWGGARRGYADIWGRILAAQTSCEALCHLQHPGTPTYLSGFQVNRLNQIPIYLKF